MEENNIVNEVINQEGAVIETTAPEAADHANVIAYGLGVASAAAIYGTVKLTKFVVRKIRETVCYRNMRKKMTACVTEEPVEEPIEPETEKDEENED